MHERLLVFEDVIIFGMLILRVNYAANRGVYEKSVGRIYEQLLLEKRKSCYVLHEYFKL